MPQDLKFNDNTILSTPNPIHSSSMTSDSKKLSITYLDDIPERLSDVDNSFGQLSIKSGDMLSPYRLSDAALERQKEREKALHSLKAFKTKQAELTSLPSRYLRKSDVSEVSCGGYIHSESTISESDLIPSNSSTPRGSLSASEFLMRDRPSMASSLLKAARSIGDLGCDMSIAFNQFHKSIELDDASFRSGAAAIEKLEQDERSWEQKNIPAQLREFSIASPGELKLSMGSFFKERSDDLPKMLGKSPLKTQAPVRLIETSVSSQSLVPNDEESTFGISDIQHILSSEGSPSSALNVLLKPMKPTKTKSPARKSLSNDFKECQEKNLNEASKENISPELHERSEISSRCSSSLSSLPNGKLPIATTKTEIIWGCIKPGKTSTQQFIVRNRSSSRIGIQCSVSNPSFRLNKEGSDLNFSSMVKLVLHPYESRTLTVTYAPTNLGASVDNINFNSKDTNHKQSVKQFIRLYGYGGHGNLTIHKIIKDTTGKYLLSLGSIDDDHPQLKQSFMLKNSGSLATFAYCEYHLNGLYPFSNIEIFPKTVVLVPGEEKHVVVTYNVHKKDFNHIKSKINSCVIDIGKIQVIHGTEVDRARLRRICLKLKEKKQEVNPFALALTEKFPGEVAPTDLKHFKETSLEEILQLLNNEEIIITLEQDIDQTLVGQLQDETAMFRSLCESTALDSFNGTTKETCQIDPTRIILTPPDKIKDRIFLTNNNKKTMYFEVNSSPEGLLLRPQGGTIKSGETLIIELMYTKSCNDKTVFKVRILVDNESFDVDVKVVFVRT